jgi:hypothetical protein
MAALELRKDQKDTMASRCQNGFEQRLVRHLRKAFPDETQEMSDPLLLERTRPSVKKAEEYGVEMEYDVVRFVDLTFLLGADFGPSPDGPWAQDVLEGRTLAGWQTVHLLWAWVKEDLTRFFPGRHLVPDSFGNNASRGGSPLSNREWRLDGT